MKASATPIVMPAMVPEERPSLGSGVAMGELVVGASFGMLAVMGIVVDTVTVIIIEPDEDSVVLVMTNVGSIVAILVAMNWVVVSILCPSSSSNVAMLAAGELIVGAVIVCLRQENALWI